MILDNININDIHKTDMKSVKRLFFKNRTTGYFSLLLASSTALFGYKKWSDGQMQHPLVLESIELLRKEK